jgi:ribosomal-protein-alanine N-acetyltransferase
MKVNTPRLTLIAATLPHLDAELAIPIQLGTLLNASLPADWPPGEYDRNAQEFFRDTMSKSEPESKGWFGWYAITKSKPQTLIGAGGFIGLPDENGEIMMGFSVSKDWYNQGYATEMSRPLIDRALADERIKIIAAYTTISNISSRKVLKKLGFTRVGTNDSDDPLRFEIRRD